MIKNTEKTPVETWPQDRCDPEKSGFPREFFLKEIIQLKKSFVICTVSVRSIDICLSGF